IGLVLCARIRVVDADARDVFEEDDTQGFDRVRVRSEHLLDHVERPKSEQNTVEWRGLRLFVFTDADAKHLDLVAWNFEGVHGVGDGEERRVVADEATIHHFRTALVYGMDVAALEEGECGRG